ncbi:MAG TPA: NAD(P)/FAD-dependent oxidoreductase [Gemmatimonadaceae bacterium]|nr:NAD(P)/FAD-dependent oxidoreductase [Gemmatimonadaceae bacterium]
MPPRPRVVIIGSGFAGLAAAKTFRGESVDVTVIDRTNHHLFQPLLYQVATAGLAPSDITVPIRWILRNERNARVVLGEVVRVDPLKREVIVDDIAAPVVYDLLIVTTGSHHSYFGHDAWAANAPGLKSLEDALEIRRRFLMAFERAEQCANPDEQRALMTFVIVGGGPTGVELAGMMVEIVRKAMPKDFRTIDTRASRIILVEGGPRLLPAMPARSSARARRDLERLGVEVRTSATVNDVNEHGARVGEEFVPAGNVFWAAGNQASPLGAMLGGPVDRAGRVLVRDDLSVPGHPEIFVAGDLAAVKRADGSLVPGVAPAAMQEGRVAAQNALRIINAETTRPFRYYNKGDLATIGRNRAVAVFGGRVEVSGYPAWLLWLFVHIMYLVGFRNRVSVLIQWAYAYFTFQRGVRLITAAEGAAPAITGAGRRS